MLIGESTGGSSALKTLFREPALLRKPSDNISTGKLAKIFASGEFRKQLQEKECIKKQKLEEMGNRKKREKNKTEKEAIKKPKLEEREKQKKLRERKKADEEAK